MEMRSIKYNVQAIADQIREEALAVPDGGPKRAYTEFLNKIMAHLAHQEGIYRGFALPLQSLGGGFWKWWHHNGDEGLMRVLDAHRIEQPDTREARLREAQRLAWVANRHDREPS